MKEKEFKFFPDHITKKLLALKEEKISQDIEIYPVLLFLTFTDRPHFSYEHMVKVLKDTGYPFGAEILDLQVEYAIISFDIFREYGDEIQKAFFLANNLIELDFIKNVFITKKRGFLHYVNITTQEFLLIDSGARTEYYNASKHLDEGIFIDENIYYELYHNVKAEPVSDRILKVLSEREYFIPYMRPNFVGKNPLKNLTKSKIIRITGNKGSGKTHMSLDFLQNRNFEIIGYVKLSPHLRYVPYSAIKELSKSLKFYKENDDKPPFDFIKELILSGMKIGIFFEDADYIDPESRELLEELFTFIPDTNVFIFEGGKRWEDEITFNQEGYINSTGVLILKSLAGGRRPDKSILEILSAIDDLNYQFIYDFYTIFSLKKYFIFGEDAFYINPAAHNIKGQFSRVMLYKILLEELEDKEVDELLKIVILGNMVKLSKVNFRGLFRLIRHDILRLHGKYIGLCSKEIASYLLNQVDRNRLLNIIEKELTEIDYPLRGYLLNIIGEKRGAFREFKNYFNAIRDGNKTRKLIIQELLELEPTLKERVDLLINLYHIDKEAGNEESAMIHLKSALSPAKASGDKSLIAKVLYKLGKHNIEIGQSGAAIMNLKDALRFAKDSEDKDIYTSILVEMAKFYKNKNNADKLDDTLRKLQSVCEGNEKCMTEYLFYRGVYYLMKENLNRAYETLENAYSLASKKNNKVLLPHILAFLSKVEFLLGQYRIAEKYANESLSLDSSCIESRLVLSKIKFINRKVDESYNLLFEIFENSETKEPEVFLDAAALLAYKGEYKKATELIDKIDIKNKPTIKEIALKRKVRYLLRLGLYAKAYKIIGEIKDEELNDEFYMFLLGHTYKPKSNTPYIKCVAGFTMPQAEKKLDTTIINEYDYIDAEWMMEFMRAINELRKGKFDVSYQIRRNIKNMYFRASLDINIAKYIMDFGGDGNPFLREAGKFAEEKGYNEVLLYLYLISQRKDKVMHLVNIMFEDNKELRDKYIYARKYLLKER